ncbi:hypothetical protein E2J16_06955 [Campylobacter coli]|nr:hypothetical protein [Campylobacter coli]
MEIYGYIPVLPENLSNVLLDKDRIYIEGVETNTPNTYKCVLSARCIVENQKVPSGDEEVNDNITATYSKYVTISTSVTITTNESLDIQSISPFDLINTTGKTVSINRLNSTIVNLIDTGADTKKTTQVLDKVLDTLDGITLPDLDINELLKRDGKVYSDIYKDPSCYMLSNGVVEKVEKPGENGMSGKTVYTWRGTYPLDILINVIQSNLDILVDNDQLKGDSYAMYFTQLFQTAMIQACELDKYRLNMLEQAEQFRVKSQLDFYLGLIKLQLDSIGTLADYEVKALNKAINKIQVKMYDTQIKGIKSNNITKLLSAQLDASSSAFTAGMTETVPPTNNNAELMSLYSQAKSQDL